MYNIQCIWTEEPEGKNSKQIHAWHIISENVKYSANPLMFPGRTFVTLLSLKFTEPV